jgi:type I restriction enzyme S subunit
MKHSGVDWLGDVPADWETSPLRSLMNLRNERNNAYQSDNYLSLMANVGIIPYAEKGDVGNKAPEDLGKCKIVSKGDFVLNSMNFGIGSFGVTNYEGILSPVYLVLRPILREVNYSYFSNLFMTSLFREYAQMFGSGILEHRSAIPWEKLKTIVLPLPPRIEQDAISLLAKKEVGQIDSLVNNAKKAIELLKERRQALITQVVTGKIDVRGFAGGNS